MSQPRGRPTNEPGVTRQKVQPWVHPDTAFALKLQARNNHTSIGHILDQWFRERAQQSAKTLAPLPQKNKPTEEDEVF